MMKKFLSKTLVLFLAFLMVFSCFGTMAFAVTADAVQGDSSDAEEDATKLEEIRELLNSNEYAEYRAIYGDAPFGEDDVTIKGAEFNAEKTTAAVATDTFLGSESEVVLIPGTGDVTWDFYIKKTGNYHISITYAPVVEYDADGDGVAEMKSNAATIKRALLLDGTYPFKQSRYIELSRVWMDVFGAEGANDRGFEVDNDGSEIKPDKIEVPEWKTVLASDSTGYVVEPFLYYIEEGQHTLSLKEVQEYLGVGRETILQWIAKRNMPAYKVGRLWKFKLSEVDAWIRSGGAADDNSKEDEE